MRAPRRPLPLLALLLVLAAPGGGQETGEDPRGDDAPMLGETIVTAARAPRVAFDTPFSAESVTAERIRDQLYRTTPQALRDLPGVMVQETSHGQGSPFIRGFTGYRNLFLIDGIRLNNSVFRDGPNQYWNTVDPLSLERIEVVKGPSAVLYGSDAIGGTVNAITKSPYAYDARGGARGFAGELFARVATAEESFVGRVEASAAAPGGSTGVLLGVSAKDFGDVHGGRDTGEQPNTGYGEWDADLKLEHFLDSHTRLVAAYQHVRQDDVPRTHRTVFAVPFEGTTVGSDLRRDLDQERQLAYVQLHGDGYAEAAERYSMSLSWHRQREERDRIRGSGARDLQGFDVDSYGVFANLTSESSIGRLTAGVDYYHDEVDSFSSRNPVQGPVGDDATYDLLGVFVQDEIEASEELTLTLGARFDYARADADSVLDPVTSAPTSVEDDWSAVVGSARFLYRLSDEEANLFGGVSQGFRAPNLSDLTRFDSARTNELEIPAPGLDAENTLTYEVGAKTRHETLSSQASVFYTDIEDLIVRVPTGTTTPQGEFEVTKANAGDGYLWGVELAAAHRFHPSWTAFGNATYLEGEVETFPTSAPVPVEEYVDRLMPLTAQLGVRWEGGRGRWVEAVGIYADDADRLSTRDRNDTSRIPPGGTPGYLLLHLRAGLEVGRARLHAGLENLTDEDYRVHGSGSNGPGRSLVLGMTVSM